MVTTAPSAVGTRRAPDQAADPKGRQPTPPRAPGQDPTEPPSGPQRATRDVPARLYTVDGLRFAAALGVMLYHFVAVWSTVWGENPAERFAILGQVAVYFALAPELFFVVSGFVILWTAWGRSVPKVVASRLSRVYPPYWAALALTSVLLLVIWPAGKEVSLGEALVNVTLLQEAFGVRHVDGVYWTLWAELRFYLLIVALVAIGLTRRRVIAFAAIWPPVALLVDVLGNEFLTTLLISRYAPFFAGGMLMFLIFRYGHSWWLWTLVTGNVALATYNTVEPMTATLNRVTEHWVSPVLLGVIVVACFGGVALLSMTRLARLEWRFLVGLGAITYPLYLVHQFWGWWVIDMLHDTLPDGVTLLAAIAVSLGLALLVHHGVEKRLSPPMRRWLERVLTRGRRDAADAPSRSTTQGPRSTSRVASS